MSEHMESEQSRLESRQSRVQMASLPKRCHRLEHTVRLGLGRCRLSVGTRLLVLARKKLDHSLVV